jgi:uncharacterized protein (DUF1015 family)
MTKIAPFAGLRYNPQQVDLSRVVAPPYDVINEALREELSRRSPHNVVRLDLAKEENGLSRYEIAGKNLWNWKEKKILQRDARPSLYLYFQTFRLPGGETRTRKGFFGVRRLEKFGEGSIKPHENTFPGPKADRLQLMNATHADLSPIFSLFSDPKNEAGPILDELAKGEPEVRIVEPGGDEHRLWLVSDPAAVERLLHAVRERPLLIADGHHRYETALAYQEEQKAALGSRYRGDEPFHNVLMYFSSLQDPGLTVLPTHRVLAQPSEVSPELFQSLLKKFAHVASFAAEDREAAVKKMEEEGAHEHVLGWVYGDRIDVAIFDVARLLEHPALNRLHFALRDLDVTVLHDLVLAELLGITKGAQKEYGRIHYVKDAGEAIRLAREGGTYAFLMNATKLKQIEAVAEIGEKMPQKSTFFYPKLLTGLVFYELAEGNLNPVSPIS